ncbi:MAG TPA: hypothetical protein VIL74_24245 [Pyrinomonadaceae bacterium]|jgi:hypothetical protein
MKNLKIYLIYSALLAIVCGSVSTYGQNTEQSKKSDEPALAPLTEEEKKLNPRSIVENQPDFTAVQGYFSAREISGFSAVSKIARKGGKFRTDTGFVVIITEANKPAIRLNGDKTYEEEVAVRKPFVSATMPLNPTDLLAFSDVSFTALGTIELEGDKLLKIQAKSRDFNQEVFLYADLGQKNLLTIIQILSPARNSIQRLKDVSFEVPDVLFDISGYKPLPKFKWEKVKTAKVFYDGKLRKDFSVFRFENYLFVDLQEPHPATGLMLHWHYLVNMRRKTAEIAYQGMLTTEKGELAWQSDASEAFSTVELSEKIDTPVCEDKNCPPVVVEPNQIIFPSVYYEDRKSLVKVTW